MSFAGSVFAVFRRDVLITVLKVATSIVVARRLGPSAMGVWVILMFIPSYADVLARLNLENAAVFYIPKGRYRLGEIAFTLNLAALVCGLAAVAVVCAGVGVFERAVFKNVIVDRALIYLMALSIPAHFMYTNYVYLAIGLEDVSTYRTTTLLREGVASVLGMILVMAGAGVTGLVSAFLIGIVIGLAHGYSRITRVEPMRPVLNRMLLRDLFRYSVPFYLGSLVGSVNVQASAALVAIYLNPAQVAFLKIAQDAGQLLNRIPGAVSTLLLPRLSRFVPGDADAVDLSARSFRIVISLLTATGMAIAILAAPMVRLVYGEMFRPVTTVLWVLLPGFVLSGASNTVFQYFNGIGRPGIVLGISTVILVLQVGACVLVIPRYGLIGTAAVMSLALVASGVVTIMVFKKVARPGAASRLIPQRTDLVTIAGFLRRQWLAAGLNLRARNAA